MEICSLRDVDNVQHIGIASATQLRPARSPRNMLPVIFTKLCTGGMFFKKPSRSSEVTTSVTDPGKVHSDNLKSKVSFTFVLSEAQVVHAKTVVANSFLSEASCEPTWEDDTRATSTELRSIR